jgi:hypothetical protein
MVKVARPSLRVKPTHGSYPLPYRHSRHMQGGQRPAGKKGGRKSRKCVFGTPVFPCDIQKNETTFSCDTTGLQEGWWPQSICRRCRCLSP